jgi:hypothetical protein
MRHLPLALLLALSACVPDTSREPVTVPVYGRGVETLTATVGDYTVTLLDARVVVGPLYFCSAAHASDELCSTARLEVLEPFVVDLLDASAQEGGLAHGTTGRVSSAQFDLGRSFFAASASPAPTSGALGGRSAVFTFEVEGPVNQLTVELNLDLDPARSGSTLVMGARTSADVTRETESVTLSFDPWIILDSIDLALLEASVDDDGEWITPGRGEQAYEAVAVRLTEGRMPSFVWSTR